MVDEKVLDAIFMDRDWSQRPGIAAGISINGETVYRKGFGLASADLSVALSPTIRMRIASVSKQFTALAYLLLCEQGRARIDDPIGAHVLDLHPRIRDVTMLQLMGHNSGIRDAVDLCAQLCGIEHGRVTMNDLLSFYRMGGEVNFEAGISHKYNNGGWILVSAAIEHITGRLLSEVLRAEVFEPVGMFDTLLRPWSTTCVPNSATCHALNGDGTYEKVEMMGGLDSAGSGHIVSTVDDMLRWLAHMRKPKVGNEDTWKRMKTPQHVRNGTSTGYGCGLSNERYRGIDIIWHSGGGSGCNAQMIKVPDKGIDIIAMSNSSDIFSPSYAERVLEVLIPELEAPTQDVPYEGPFPTGVFRSQKTRRAIAIGRGDTGYYLKGTEVPVAAIDGHFYPVAPDRDGILRPCSALFGEFSIEPLGDLHHPSALRLTQFGETDDLPVVPSPTGTAVPAPEGRYWCAETEVSATIERAVDGVLEVRFDGRYGKSVHGMESLATRVWRTRTRHPRIKPQWGFLLFDDDDAFDFTNTSNRNIRFVRN